ncbi:substrate-binding periplasmic protein [Cerasicoccus frondis]|uniref:substrate-binding periplasmic protein n=1 Tax=Cerasicoccus frondis TaxID=490090 RepID=UPI002852BCCA|nr:transporter substrate-binding domain-containing protein [Cerasicoccus frondis]
MTANSAVLIASISFFRAGKTFSGFFGRFLLVCALMMAGLGMGGCESLGGSSKSSASTQMAPSPNVLRVGVSADMPPFVYKQDGKLVGLEIDMARQMGKDLGREVYFIEMDWEDLIPALQADKIDILMAGMNYTPERNSIISMTTPYMNSGQMALVLRKNAGNYALAGQIGNTKGKVGAEKGTTGEFLVQSSFPNAELVTFDSAEKGALAVADGKVDMLIHDAPTIYWLAGTYQNRGVTPARPVLTVDQMVWGVSRDNPELLQKVNSLVVTWAANGELNRIVRRWVSI